ncbi:TPR-like protein, partial [Athelia psychrophila]
SGKSAIAHTVAQSLQKEGLLASSFFFDRKIPSRNTPRVLFSTIARDLANINGALAEDITATLENELGLASAPLSRQFNALILEPSLRHATDRPIVIVIDALDEVIGDNLELLRVLRDEAAKLPPQFRILITSRPTSSAERFLSRKGHVATRTIDIFSPENRQDVAVYIDIQLRDNAICAAMGPDWPDIALIRDLKRLTEGLFIWIATVCSYLRSVYNPRAKLSALLSKSAPQGLPVEKKMDNLDATILDVSGDWKDGNFLQDYNITMGAIMAFKRPLSLAAFQALHYGVPNTSPGQLLNPFGSVLTGFQNLHEPIRILHHSFREFITDRANNDECNRKFYISETVYSRRLAQLCLQTTNRELQTPPPETGYLAKNEGSYGIPNFSGVSEQLLYCCEFLNDHMSDLDSPVSDVILGHIRETVTHHLTTWMEIVTSKTDQEALGFYRELALQEPTKYNEELALSLNNLSCCLWYLGSREDALDTIQEVVGLQRELAVERPMLFNSSLAISLSNLSIYLSNLGQCEAALTAAQEVVELDRAFAIRRPAISNPNLANSLDNLSNHLSALGRRVEALVGFQEAVNLRRALAAERPAEFNADLAASLNNLSICLSYLGRRGEALELNVEAVELYQALATERPAAFNVNLAKSLHNLSDPLADLDRHEEALSAIQEAVDLHRELALEQPRAFNATLASSIDNLSNRYLDVHIGQPEEALTAIEEAVNLRKRLVETHSEISHRVDLANALEVCSDSFSGPDRVEEALRALQDAIYVRRDLRTTSPDAYLAASLKRLSRYFSKLDRQEEALTAIQEAVELYRALVADHPTLFLKHLAGSLDNLSSRLSDVGWKHEALISIQEAVDLRRDLAAEQPDEFNVHLAQSLHHLSLCLSDLGRQGPALVAIHGAVILYEQLEAQ